MEIRRPPAVPVAEYAAVILELAVGWGEAEAFEEAANVALSHVRAQRASPALPEGSLCGAAIEGRHQPAIMRRLHRQRPVSRRVQAAERVMRAGSAASIRVAAASTQERDRYKDSITRTRRRHQSELGKLT